jgi:hypothetical protein
MHVLPTCLGLLTDAVNTPGWIALKRAQASLARSGHECTHHIPIFQYNLSTKEWQEKERSTDHTLPCIIMLL